MTRLLATAAVTALVATGASAGDFSKSGPAVADPVVPAPATPVAAPRFNWTGAYAGAGIGYGRMSISGNPSQSSAVAGAFAGYRWDMGSAVYGVEGLLSPAFGSPTLPNGDRIRGGASLLLTAGIPISADARTLGYAGIGPSIVRTSGAGGSKTSAGATVQVGLDHMLTDQMMVRGALNYTAINSVSNAGYKTRTLGAGVGLAFKF
ncbi:MAG: outer membrane protein [Roseinatronobacter sp.]